MPGFSLYYAQLDISFDIVVKQLTVGSQRGCLKKVTNGPLKYGDHRYELNANATKKQRLYFQLACAIQLTLETASTKELKNFYLGLHLGLSIGEDRVLLQKLKIEEDKKRKVAAGSVGGANSGKIKSNEWKLVVPWVTDLLDAGVTKPEACRRAAKLLKNGKFQGISRKIEIQAESIVTRLDRAAKRKREKRI
jgi:hypothetical protein